MSAADPAVWDETMRVNLRGALVAIQAAVPHMIARGGGSVINTASGAGLAGDLRNPGLRRVQGRADQPDPVRRDRVRQAGHTVQRHIARLHRHPGEAPAARRCRRPCCGTHLTPRLGRPEDIAALVVFLACDESAFITGQNICVDGGMLAHQPFLADFRT